MSCDIGKATERLENEQSYVTTHSPFLPSLYLRHSSFSNPSVASPSSQFILQPFFRFSYVTSASLNLPGVPSMYSTRCENRRKKSKTELDNSSSTVICHDTMSYNVLSTFIKTNFVMVTSKHKEINLKEWRILLFASQA